MAADGQGEHPLRRLRASIEQVGGVNGIILLPKSRIP